MRHKIIINVINEKEHKTNVLKGAVGKIPNRLIKFFFGRLQANLSIRPWDDSCVYANM